MLHENSANFQENSPDAARVSQLEPSAAPTERSPAIDDLVPIIYNELHALAFRYLAHERKGHTLQPTALVHEAYIRLVRERHGVWESKAHLLGIAARAMRQILVQYARAHQAVKRGGELHRVAFEETLIAIEGSNAKLVALDEALGVLSTLDSRVSAVVELRFFGGLTIQETTEVLGVSTTTVERDWRAARAWLHRELGRD